LLSKLTWSADGIDKSTGLKGVGIYWPENDASVSAVASDGKTELSCFKDTRNATPDAENYVLYLKVYGGRTAYEQCPQSAYININQNYIGPRLMEIDAYEALCKQQNIPVMVSANALDKWSAARK